MKISFKKEYTTHIPILIKVIQMSKGPILEIGSGLFSTPLLHWLCHEKGRKLVTYENVPDYFKFAKRFQSRNHRIRFVKDWEEIDAKTHWGVALIDHEPAARRRVDILKLKDKADYIVIHDTEREDKYEFQKIWPLFKYRYDWKGCKPWTTVVSNFKDLSNLSR